MRFTEYIFGINKYTYTEYRVYLLKTFPSVYAIAYFPHYIFNNFRHGIATGNVNMIIAIKIN